MAIRKLVEVYSDGKLYKTYNSLSEVSVDFNRNQGYISNMLRLKGPELEINGKVYTFKTSLVEKKEPRIKKVKPPKVIKDAALLPGETEDQCRRRLGLNPYGEWRNDEWLFAMFDRVAKELYPDGYDEHTAWLAQRASDRIKAGKAKPRDPNSNMPGYESEEESYNDIDQEFLDYVN